MSQAQGFVVGFCIGLLLAIAYDTSADVSALEGGHSHLRFVACVVIGIVGGGVGVLAVVLARERERTRPKR